MSWRIAPKWATRSSVVLLASSRRKISSNASLLVRHVEGGRVDLTVIRLETASSDHALLVGWSALYNMVVALGDGDIDLLADLIHLLFSIEVSPNNIIRFDKRVKFLLKLLVLHCKQGWVFLQSIILLLKVQVSVHESLVRVVDGLQVCVHAPLLNFQAVEFCL